MVFVPSIPINEERLAILLLAFVFFCNREVIPPTLFKNVQDFAEDLRQSYGVDAYLEKPFKMTSASACWRFAMAVNETFCAASETPRITPVSCTGKNPLGT